MPKRRQKGPSKTEKPQGALTPQKTKRSPLWPPIAFSALILLCPLLPWHPLAFLPPLLFWPAYIAGALAIALAAPFASAPPILTRSKVALSKAFEPLALILIFGSYFLLKLVGLHASGTDDNIYFYMAKRLSEGAIPYRDFFFAHPPMHLIIPALLFKVFGFSIGLAKAIPALAQGLAGLFLYLSVRPASTPLAVLTLLMHLLAYQVLMGSTDMNGENLMSAFLFASLYASTRAYPLLSGLLSAFGLGCGLYGAAFVLTLGLAFATSQRAHLLRWLYGLLGGFALLSLPFVVLSGHAFLEGVFLYHLAKPIKGEKWPLFESLNPFTFLKALSHNLGVWLGSQEFRKFLYYHAPQVVAALLAFAILTFSALRAWFFFEKDASGKPRWLEVLTPSDLLSKSPKGFAKLGILGLCLFTLQWAALNEVYDFYQVPMIGLLAIPAGYALLWPFSNHSQGKADLIFRLLVLILFSLHLPWASYLGRSLWPDEWRDKGALITYDWRDPEVLSGPAQLTKALFFKDFRHKGEVTPYYLHYMWNKRLAFSKAGEIAAYVQENSEPHETITGASTLAPLVALLAGRRIAADEADTNSKRFRSGLLSERTFFERICRDNVRFILSAPRSYFTEDFMRSNKTIQAYFKPDKAFEDEKLIHFGVFPIQVYRRQGETPKDGTSVCEPK